MIEWIVGSSILAAVVVVLHYALKGKISPRLQYALWGLVLLRLLLPFNLGTSKLSLMNTVETMPVVQEAERISGVDHIERLENGTVEGFSQSGPQQSPATVVVEDSTEEEYVRMKTMLTVREVLEILWLCGMAALLGVFACTNLRLALRLRRSRCPLEVEGAVRPVYVTAEVDSPCLFGLFAPAIYVTPEAAADETVLRHTVEHETTHLRHGDHIWAILRGVCLALHWYNPLVWWAACLSRDDGELACDETTIKRIGEGQRVAYGRTLIGMTCRRHAAILVTATTMSGSKKLIKERIMLIAKKPKMAIYTLVAVLLIAAVAAGCTFTGAAGGKEMEGGNAHNLGQKGETMSAEEAFDAILQGKLEFVTADTEQSLTIGEAGQAFTSDVVAKADRYALSDLDGDGTPEMILGLAAERNDSLGFVVLRYEKDEVCGYVLGYRSFMELKEDGTFSFVGGMDDVGYGSLQFSDRYCSVYKDTFSQSEYDADGNTIVSYYVDGKDTTKQDFMAEIGRQSEKTDVIWHPVDAPALYLPGAEMGSELPVLTMLGETEGYYTDFLLTYGENMVRFRGAHKVWWDAPKLAMADLDGDHVEEIVVVLTSATGTGLLIEDLYVFDSSDLSQYDSGEVLDFVRESISFSSTPAEFIIDTPFAQHTISKSELPIGEKYLSDTVSVWNLLRFSVEDGKLYCTMGCQVGVAEFWGELVLELALQDGEFVCTNCVYDPPSGADVEESVS